MEPFVIAISGTSSNTGKTTLLCKLLAELARDSSWEAIKLSRGHHRSCGKDPETCCVGGMIGLAPVIRSGRESNCEAGKDTGRYWEAGASNVHWVIVSDGQVGEGIAEALSRVVSGRVFIEGTSMLRHIHPGYSILVTPPDPAKIKPSAREGLLKNRFDAICFTEDGATDRLLGRFLASLRDSSNLALDPGTVSRLDLYPGAGLDRLVARIRSLEQSSRPTNISPEAP